MPVYEYRCKACDKTHEIEHGFNDPRPTRCPACGGQLVRVFHPIGLVFKGSGFHSTDYGKRASGEKSPAPAAAEKSDGKPGEAKPAQAKAPDVKPKDSKVSGPPGKPKGEGS
jgi:putative FmdB family regulatory protein